MGVDLENLVKHNVSYHSSHLTSGYIKARRSSQDESKEISTPPSKWPGK